jgi:hypothetical protein
MNEKDIRDRIGQFLKKTARTVVVPASVGIGLSSGACDGNGIKQAGDAGLDSGTKQVDAAQVDAARTGPDQPDAAIKYDIPLMMVPYVVAMSPDTAAPDFPNVTPPYLAPPPRDAATDPAGEPARADADSDARTDARPDLAAVEVSRPETYRDTVRAEIPFPPPPYLAPTPSLNELTDDDSPKSPSKK